MNDEKEKKNNKKSQEKDNNVENEIVEVVSLDVGQEGERTPELDAETTLDLLEDAREDNYEEEIARYTDDETIQESLMERQDLNTGQDQLLDKLQNHHAKSPELSGGDIDAAWEDANVGEETAGGMAPTPDQDLVDEIGQAYGITYEVDEPLRTAEKLRNRDEERWELDPESAEEDGSPG